MLQLCSTSAKLSSLDDVRTARAGWGAGVAIGVGLGFLPAGTVAVAVAVTTAVGGSGIITGAGAGAIAVAGDLLPLPSSISIGATISSSLLSAVDAC